MNQIFEEHNKVESFNLSLFDNNIKGMEFWDYAKSFLLL